MRVARSDKARMRVGGDEYWLRKRRVAIFVKALKGPITPLSPAARKKKYSLKKSVGGGGDPVRNCSCVH